MDQSQTASEEIPHIYLWCLKKLTVAELELNDFVKPSLDTR